MELVILVPVLGRPHRVRPLLDSIRRATSVDHRVLFLTDEADRTEREAIRREGAEDLVTGGGYAKKINDGVRATAEPLIFAGADDLDFRAGWLEAAQEKLSTQVGAVGTQDLCNPRVIAGEHATHFLLARWYAEQPTIDGKRGPFFEGYGHMCVDDEFIATARKRDAYAFAGDSVVEHLHPMVQKAPKDATYRRGRRSLGRDLRTLRRREYLWT